ncbi:MAG: hypothetical protein WCG25_00590 [bacterium]
MLINIREILNPKITSTGAKISLIKFFNSNAHNSFESFQKSTLNTSFIIIIGLKAIAIHNIPTLANIIIASARIGKISIIPINAFIINFKTIPNVIESHHSLVSHIVPKFKVLEYMVINGPTNHFDLSISVDRVVQSVMLFNRQLHQLYQKLPVDNKLKLQLGSHLLGSYFVLENKGIINQHSSNQLRVALVHIISSSAFL